MDISISEINKEELRAILRVLPIEQMRTPIIDDNKLAKRYISGFRANNVTYIQLIPVYYQEIHNHNTDVERALKSALYSYIKECNLEEKLELLSEDVTWEKCIELGIAIGESGCEIGIDILLKISSSTLPDEQKNLISMLQEKELKNIANSEKIVSEYEKKISENDKEIERLKKEVNTSSEKRRKSEELRKEEEAKAITRENRIGSLEQQLNDLSLEKEEIGAELNKKDQKIEQAEATIKEQEIQIKKASSELKLLQDELAKATEDNKKLQDKRQLEFDEAIKRLVSDTIEDLKEDYDIEISEYEKIVGELGEDKSILSTWELISKKNALIIDEIQNSMRNNIVKMDIIDQCNEVENNVLLKYVIVKAIKSLYFELMSSSEKNKKILGALK